MAVEVNDGGMSIKVSLDTSDIDKDAERLKAKLSKTQQDINTQLDKVKGKISNQSKELIQDSLEGFNQLDGSYKRIFTNIQLYQVQLEKLARAEKELASLRRSGSITQGEYNTQVTALRQRALEAQTAVKGLAEQLQNLNKPVKVDGLSEDSLNTLAKASQSFDDLSPNLQRAINQMVLLENEFEQLQRAEADLSAQLSKGTINLQQYNQGVAGIRASMLNTRAELKKTAMEIEVNRTALSGQNLNKGWDGLGNSIAQISRELPAFTFSAQTGFLAISNNIPILADEIKRLQIQNQALTASGQKAVPVWKQVLTGFVSWQTLIPVLITLLTVYGKEIADFVKGLFGAKKGFDELKVSQEALNKAFEDTSFVKAIEEVQELKTNLELAKQGFIDKEGVIKQYNESIGKVTKEVKTLKEAEQGLIDNAENYVKASLYKAAADFSREESAKRLSELLQDQLSAEKELERAQQQFDNSNSGQAVLSGTGATSNVSNAAQALENAKTNLEEIKGLIKETEKDALDIDKKFKELSLGTGINLIIGEDEEESKDLPKQVIDRRKDLLQKIAELDREYARMKLNEDQAELDALREKFDKIRALVTEFNKDPRNAQVQIEVESINRIQAEAESDLIYKQETQSLSDEYEKRKSLYQEYEAFVRDFGISEAQKRYGGEFELAKDYLGKIQAEYDKINTIPVEDRSGSQNERLKLFKRVLDQESMEQEQAYLRNLKSFLDFNQRRQILEENYQKQRAEIVKRGDLQYLDEFDRQYQEQQAKLNDEAFKKGSGLNEFFANIETMARDKALAEVKRLREELEKFDNLKIEEGGISDELVTSVKTALDNIEKNINDEIPAGMLEWASALEDVGSALGGIDSQLGQIIGSVTQAVRGFAEIKNLTNELKLARDSNNDAAAFTASANLVAVAATSLIGIFNLVSKAAKQRKQAEEQYYRSIIGLQREYNLALNDQIRLRGETNGNVFMTDYQGELTAGYAALLDAETNYNEALEKLADARVKIGTKNKIDLGSAAGSTALGAIAGTAIGAIATGAAIGSIVPGIGTVIGAGVGAIIGLFATKKKKDSYGSLLEEFPDLVRQGTDGLLEINRELALALINNGLLDESTQQLVESVLDWQDAIKEAREQIAGVIGGLIGQIGGELESVLVNAFKAGEDAAEAMADTVEKAIERLISGLAFAVAIKPALDQYQKDLIESLDPINGDQNTLDDSERLIENLIKGQDLYNQILSDAQKAAEEAGLDIFRPDGLGAQRGLSGAIRRELTEETAGELAGLFRGQFDITKRHYQVAVDQLSVQLKIEQNTFMTVQEIKISNQKLEAIIKNTKSLSNRDFGIDG